MATLRLLRAPRLHGRVFPEDQTCCGQPMANAGCDADAAAAGRALPRASSPGYEYVVAPRGSCVAMVRHHLPGPGPGDPAAGAGCAAAPSSCASSWIDVLEGAPGGRRASPTRSACTAAATACASCALASGSERMVAALRQGADAPLAACEGIELVELARPDECCGFGGTFAVTEEAVSCMMGRDRIADHDRAGAEVITGVRHVLPDAPGRAGPARGAARLRVMHVAEMLPGRRGSWRT